MNETWIASSFCSAEFLIAPIVADREFPFIFGICLHADLGWKTNKMFLTFSSIVQIHLKTNWLKCYCFLWKLKTLTTRWQKAKEQKRDTIKPWNLRNLKNVYFTQWLWTILIGIYEIILFIWKSQLNYCSMTLYKYNWNYWNYIFLKISKELLFESHNFDF